ncbi:MAG: LamG-like jellyroll fold domain-containing protein [Planctomycetota bacterium]
MSRVDVRAWLVMGLFLPAMVCTAGGRTITVDDDGAADFNNIQAAIDAANNGETVIVAEGTYTGPGNRNIDFKGKAITVRSTDPNDSDVVAATTINCQGTETELHRGFYFHNGERNSSIVAGLTIANGHQEYGAGIFCYKSNPTIRRCVITNNSSYGTYPTHGGGGIHCKLSSPKIENCTISNNLARSLGGGIYCEGSSASIVNCIITDNRAQSWGSGIFYKAGCGGGICCEDWGSPKITNSIITNNCAEYGGGILGGYTHLIIDHCTIAYNSASKAGGIYRYEGSGRITNSIIWGNTASSKPAVHGQFSVSNCNVEGGYSGEGNIDADPCFINADEDNYHLSSSSPCINTGDSGYISFPGDTDIDGDSRVINGITDMGADEVNYEGPLIGLSTTKVEFHATESEANPENQILGVSDIGTEILRWEIMTDCSWLEVNPVNGVSQGGVNEVTLIVDISGLGSGVYNCELAVTAAGAINSPRIVEVSLVVHAPVIQLSANSFEFLSLEDGPNPNVQELDICNADVETLHWAIDSSCDWLEVTPQSGFSTGENDKVTLNVDTEGMGRGTYICEFAVISDWAANSPQVVSVTLYIGVALHVPSEYPTIQAAINAAEKGDTVLIADGIYTGDGNRDIDFKGKAITVRSENGPENCIIDCQRLGRGFSFHSGEDAASVLDGLTITKGYSSGAGGGIFCTDSSPTITGCSIVYNHCLLIGGGVVAGGGRPVVSNCLIACNSARDCGGGLFRVNGPITNCVIAANKAASDGGGLSDCDGDITNCVIAGNIAGLGAGGLWGCDGNITGCTVSNNKSETGPAGLDWCTGSIANCIIWGNFVLRGPQLQLEYCAEPTYSCIQDWPYGSNGNIDQDPLFVSPGKEWVYWDLAPLCHWKFDEGQGDSTYDAGGRCHGDVVGAEWTEGQVGAALRFYGEFGHVLVPFRDEQPLWFNEHDSLSISAWIKCDKENSHIISKGFSDGAFYDGGFYLGLFEGRLCFMLYDWEVRKWSVILGTTVVSDEKWHYVVAVRDATEKKLHIYLDGTPDATPSPEQNTKSTGSRAPVIIGEYFRGVIDEPAIYGSALSNEQIEQFYAAGLSGERYDNKLEIGDYHLLADSPCINAGDPNYPFQPGQTDIDGQPRVIGCRVDMGADEFPLANTMPIADACSDRTEYASCDDLARVTLDGANSYDDDCDELTYLWSWTVDYNCFTVAGPAVTIELPAGEHIIQLIVNDGLADSQPDEVVVEVLPSMSFSMRAGGSCGRGCQLKCARQNRALRY